MVLVVRVLARQQDAGVEQPQVQCSGLFALTNSATPPPWLVTGPSMASISAIRSARRALFRRKVSSASSRRYPLRVVPRRPASMSTARSRSSGSDTITLAMSSVYPVLPVGINEPAADHCTVAGQAIPRVLTWPRWTCSPAHGMVTQGPASVRMRFLIVSPKAHPKAHLRLSAME